MYIVVKQLSLRRPNLVGFGAVASLAREHNESIAEWWRIPGCDGL